ncbi:hypothetical protein [Klebsiella sp. RIT-PI-d]|uniref:hypothetical protein n=1 Tax=Klebsiella sp. RIT-PI-d TaxID=1681196 RepID=UPI0011E51C40|nr:hypothetical protein [Klebsiella sp. RIT-PI-d]
MMKDVSTHHTHCPSCNELITVDAEACEHCHAHKIDNYIPHDVRLKIKALTGIVAFLPLLGFLISAIYLNHIMLTGIICLLLSVAAGSVVYQKLQTHEKKKNITVWKRRTLTW